jgi:hypothetical protein
MKKMATGHKQFLLLVALILTLALLVVQAQVIGTVQHTDTSHVSLKHKTYVPHKKAAPQDSIVPIENKDSKIRDSILKHYKF